MPADAPDWLGPDWADLPRVRACMSTRRSGGHGAAGDFDLRADAGPAPRERFAQALGARPQWLRQVHGTQVAVLGEIAPAEAPLADASVTRVPGVGCVVLVADCLPVLLAAADGRAVGAAHAGWRGLAAGVLEHTVLALCREAGCTPAELRAWLGPCIGRDRFEVGDDVLQAFGRDPLRTDDDRFRRRDRDDGGRRWLADLPALARDRLQATGVGRIDDGHRCTFEDASAFFSFRRGADRGRMAAAIALVG